MAPSSLLRTTNAGTTAARPADFLEQLHAHPEHTQATVEQAARELRRTNRARNQRRMRARLRGSVEDSGDSSDSSGSEDGNDETDSQVHAILAKHAQVRASQQRTRQLKEQLQAQYIQEQDKKHETARNKMVQDWLVDKDESDLTSSHVSTSTKLARGPHQHDEEKTGHAAAMANKDGDKAETEDQQTQKETSRWWHWPFCRGKKPSEAD